MEEEVSHVETDWSSLVATLHRPRAPGPAARDSKLNFFASPQNQRPHTNNVLS